MHAGLQSMIDAKYGLCININTERLNILGVKINQQGHQQISSFFLHHYFKFLLLSFFIFKLNKAICYHKLKL